MWKDVNCSTPVGVLSNVDEFVSVSDEVFYWGVERNITEEGGASALSQVKKLKEEVEELEEALNSSDKEEIEKEIGDVQIVILNLCRLGGFDLTKCLGSSYNKIKDRKGIMKNGIFIKEEDIGIR